jgi:hypothetical protein
VEFNQLRYALQCAQGQLYFLLLLMTSLLNSIHNNSPFNLLCVVSIKYCLPPLLSSPPQILKHYNHSMFKCDKHNIRYKNELRIKMYKNYHICITDVIIFIL